MPFDQGLANLFPDAPRVTFQGKPLIILPHGLDSTKLLRNMGVEVPAPVLSQYDWCGGTPFEVQKKTVAMLTTQTSAYVLNGMGTGKTKAALWAWDYLNKQGLANKLLVVAPLSTLTFTWAAEIFRTLPGRKYEVIYGDKKKRLARLANTEADIYIINHDGVGTVLDALKQRLDINTLVLDELAVYRNGTNDRTKDMKVLASRFKWKWGMTGSPTPNAPTDAYGQCSIITPHTVPKFFTRFREMLMIKQSNFRWFPKSDATAQVHACMQPAVRYTLDDVTELPMEIKRVVQVKMEAKQEHIYKTMAHAAKVGIGKNEITAMNAGAVLSKLLQISTGWVYTREGTTIQLENKDRVQALKDAIDACDQKVLVFVPFKHALKGIAELLIKDKYDVAVVSGDTPQGARAQTFNLFQNTSKYKVLLAHPQCLAHGITLTAATCVVWFAPTMSLEIFEQANARIRRVGQKHKQLFLMFQSTPVERKAYTMLMNKQKIQNKLLDMFEESTEEYDQPIAA